MPRVATERRASPEARRTANRERANSRGDATRLVILTTAEELFAKRGIAAVPLRDIGIAAGQKNNVAVQYHFGDREGLVREIMTYRADTSERRRVQMVADFLSRGDTPKVIDIVRAFVLPLAEHFDEANHYLAFMSRYIIERGGYVGLDVGSTVATTYNTLHTLLDRLLPDLPDAVREERWQITMTCAVHTLARYQAAKPSMLPAPLDALIEDLVRFLTRGLEAPFDEGAASASGGLAASA
jgi:AcrR family transcriptional regulator